MLHYYSIIGTSLPECSQVFSIAHWRVQSSGPSYIDIEALTWTCTHLDEDKHREEREGGECVREKEFPSMSRKLMSPSES